MSECGKENLLEKLYALSNGRIHGKKRHKVVRTHLKHIEGNFVNFTKEEYRKFIVNWYVSRLINKKPFSAAYMCAVIDSINRYKNFPKPPIWKREIFTVIKNMKKIFNSENKDSLFYTKDFRAINLDTSSINDLRNNNVITRFSDKLYENANFEILLQYNKEHLDNFLSIGSKPRIPNVQDDLSLIVVFLASSPRRIQEILKLSLKKAKDLIIHGQTRIMTKNGEDTLNIIVPQQFSQLLNEYLITTGRIKNDLHTCTDTAAAATDSECGVGGDGDDESLIFARSYFVYYSAIKTQYKTLFSTNIGRPFHAFRNYFSAKFIKHYPDATKSALGHANMKMTRSYANKQFSKTTAKNISEFLTQTYPFIQKKEI